ncbi:MAG: glycosyltransferase family 4 protein [Actinomycetota bacterium]
MATPEGILGPEEAASRATRSELAPRRRRWWRPYVPEVCITAYKDVRNMAASRRWTIPEGAWRRFNLVFVWQYHGIFRHAGFGLARALGRPLVLFVDAPQVWEAEKWGVRRPGWGRLLERIGERPQLLAADLVACVSDEVAASVASLGAREERILVTPNGVDLERFNPSVSGAQIRERFGLQGKLVVGWVGSFRPFHGLAVALQAIAVLQREMSDLALLLVGDGQERPSTQRIARELGLRDVIFTGTVPHREIPGYVAAMDVGLLLHRSDHEFHYSPLKLREYLACGKAVVAVARGEVARTLSDGVDALLLGHPTAEALASSIRRLESPLLREALGKAGRARAEREWSWDRCLDQVEELTAELPRE